MPGLCARIQRPAAAINSSMFSRSSGDGGRRPRVTSSTVANSAMSMPPVCRQDSSAISSRLSRASACSRSMPRATA
ncbi:hypothetical protein GS452_25670 [Rhodococcus hoagii]|nr:hypothetical protein [Prescottella equi]